ncbi:hypothetical protein QGN29_03965 [Temperatibacter marinus]|uniref:Uncharacterized protein n=1 Tax=Temperatibacter marinus TaxID=1456591 RepID=A0AA52EI04_9PROT|nr:hypothetical protein [Temperatibacter marinus]WND03528.1 hypothetical protein QGN29_03965 [Temperatibacter marinus]
MKDYTLSLALVDFLPVLFSGWGLCFVARWLSAIQPAAKNWVFGSIVFIFAAGLMKASWKLIVVLTGMNISFLDAQLFPVMGTGFILLAYAAVVITKDTWPNGMPILPLVLIAAAFGAGLYLYGQTGDRKWVFVGIASVTLANLVFSITMIRYSLKRAMKLPGFLFTLNLVGIFAMSGLARIENQTLAQQWAAETVNTGAQGCLLVAAWLLYKKSNIAKSHETVS